MKTLEEALIEAQVTDGKRLFAIRPDSLTLDGVVAAMETLGEDVTLMLVKPPYLVVEAKELDPGLGEPIEDFSSLVGDLDSEIEGTDDFRNEEGEEGSRGEGFEISAEDWDNVLLIGEGQADQVDALSIEWLVKAGLVETTAGGHPRLSSLALNWTQSDTNDNRQPRGANHP